MAKAGVNRNMLGCMQARCADKTGEVSWMKEPYDEGLAFFRVS